MKRCLIWGVLLLVSLILQSTLLPRLSFYGIHGDLLLIVVILSSLLMGRHHGAVVGFAAGLLQDLSSGTFFGLNTFSKMILGYVFGLVEEQIFKEHVFLPVMSMAIATVANAFITSIIMMLLGYRFDLFGTVISMVTPLIIYNVILAFPVHKMICRIRLLVKQEH